MVKSINLANKNLFSIERKRKKKFLFSECKERNKIVYQDECLWLNRFVFCFMTRYLFAYGKFSFVVYHFVLIANWQKLPLAFKKPKFEFLKNVKKLKILNLNSQKSLNFDFVGIQTFTKFKKFRVFQKEFKLDEASPLVL